MMKVGIIGIGAMGLPMANHVRDAGHDVAVFDIDVARLTAATKSGLVTASSLEDLARRAEIFLAVVDTDAQSTEVTRTLAETAANNSLIAVCATNNPMSMRRLGALCADRGMQFIDAPVVFGAVGAREGNLVSLCGGEAAHVERARPVLESYSRAVKHVGPLGAGQLAKACNNLLHWAHCVSNYEALLLAKRFGLDAQKMREVLLECPARNGTLERWDDTKFTWQEKDMDVIMDLAQVAGLMLPMSGLTDQLIKTLRPADVEALLYGPACEYLGLRVQPLARGEGGLGEGGAA